VRRHLPGIDVLRGVSVLAVILYHFEVPLFKGGYLGVDLFMVISGFLITTSLLELESKPRRLREFYLRRARRLLPGVFALIIAVVVASSFLMPQIALGGLRWDAIWSLGYSVNWRFIATSASYFDTVSPPSPFRHLWSLAIEEQFYLVWPVMFFLMPRRIRMWVVTMLAMGSAVLMHVLKTPADPFRVYYGTETRAQALLIGALLALVIGRFQVEMGSKKLKVLVWLSALIVGFAFFAANPEKSFMYSGPHMLIALCGAVLVAGAAIVPDRSISGVAAWIGAIGRRSYSLYLWHWPIIVLLSERYVDLAGWRLQVARVALIVVLSELSFQLFEMGAQQYLRSPKRVIFSSLSGCFVSLVVLTAVTADAKSIPTYLEQNRRVDQIAAASDRPFVRIIGDSVVESLRSGYEQAARDLGLRLELIVISGCGIQRGAPVSDLGEVYAPSLDCPATVASVLAGVDRTDKADVLIWQAAWDSQNREVDGKKLFVGTDDSALIALLRSTATEYLSLGERVVIVTTAERASNSTLIPDPPQGPELTRFLGSIANIRRAAAVESDAIHYVDLNEFICGGKSPCRDVSESGTRFRPSDGIHYEGPENPVVAGWILRNAMAIAGIPIG